MHVCFCHLVETYLADMFAVLHVSHCILKPGELVLEKKIPTCQRSLSNTKDKINVLIKKTVIFSVLLDVK